MRTAFYIASRLFSACDEKKWQQAAKQFVICPYYHVVSDEILPHVRPLYPYRTVAQFRADLDWLLAHYTPIRWSEIETCRAAQKPAFCLTFDDGLKEFYTVVAPILEEKGVPCVCFLNSAFIDNKDLMFRYKEALQQQGIDWRTYLKDKQPYMTSAQIRDLMKRGFEFGSHTTDHLHLDALPLSEQLTQSLDCDAALKKQFGLPHRLLALPFGQGHLSETALKAQQGTHEAVFGTANMRPAKGNLYNRIWMEDTSFKARDILHGEYLREIAHRTIRHD